MPGTSEITSAMDQLLLLQLGARLKRARLRQGLTTVQMAEQAGLSRMTLRSIEAGEPMPTIGSYLRVMRVLGVSRDLALLVNDIEATPGRKKKQSTDANRVVVTVSDKRHEKQDLQSLVLHQEAVRLMKQNPELIQRALDTLSRWQAKGNPHAQALWQEWAVILQRRSWRQALAHTGRAQQLRQASPMVTVLPQDTRLRILEEVQRLRGRVPSGVQAAPPKPL